jgi:predicted secreted hydrolase
MAIGVSTASVRKRVRLSGMTAYYRVEMLRAAISAFCLLLSAVDFTFPRDHGMHEETHTEWWYYTGHLQTRSGRRFGFELTFFRVGVIPQTAPPRTRWDLHDLGLAHFAITDVDGKRFRWFEKLNRQSPFTANAAAGYLDIFNEGWSATTMRDGSWHLVSSADGESLDLVLRTRKPPAVHSDIAGMHYYSMTRLEVTGTIRGEPCHGIAWMDHEFGNSTFGGPQQGWDWFSVQLDNDTELMLYRIRRRDGTTDPSSSGSLITSDGSVIHLRYDAMRIDPTGRWKSPKSGGTYPMGWRIAIPSLHLTLTLTPLLTDQELLTPHSTNVTYWEGAVAIAGSFENTAVSGRGYVEMTGYAR